jgi:protein-tyrosine-phosphatase
MYGIALPINAGLPYNYRSKVAKERGIEIHVESAGTAGYHVGEEPDER